MLLRKSGFKRERNERLQTFVIKVCFTDNSIIYIFNSCISKQRSSFYVLAIHFRYTYSLRFINKILREREVGGGGSFSHWTKCNMYIYIYFSALKQ